MIERAGVGLGIRSVCIGIEEKRYISKIEREAYREVKRNLQWLSLSTRWVIDAKLLSEEDNFLIDARVFLR